MARRSSAMRAKAYKARQQELDAWKSEQYRKIVAVDFIKRSGRRPVPAACITALADARCYPRREPDGTWSALDTSWTRDIVRAHEKEQRA
jgi:hypothetical protein